VQRRNISYATQTVGATTRQLGISFFEYIRDRISQISARGLDSVPSFGYANGSSGKVCAHIYRVFIYQDNNLQVKCLNQDLHRLKDVEDFGFCFHNC